MSNYNSLKTTIDANIKQNGNQEITGQILNSVLNQMVTTLGAGYQFAGVATIEPATDPGTPDAKVFYIANGKGTYTNFGGVSVTEDDVVVLYWDSSWHKVSTGIASQAKLSELDNRINNLEGKDKDVTYDQSSNYGLWFNGTNNTFVNFTSLGYDGILVPLVEGVSYTLSTPIVGETSVRILSDIPILGRGDMVVATYTDTFIALPNYKYLYVSFNSSTFTQFVVHEYLDGLVVTKKKVETIENDLSNVESFIDEHLKSINMGAEIQYDNYVNGLLDSSNGNVSSYGSACVSDFIPIVGGKTYFITTQMFWSNGLYVFYDSNKVYISGAKDNVGGSTGTKLTNEKVVAPNNASYIKVASWGSTPTGHLYDSVLLSKTELFYKYSGKKWAVVGDSLTEENARTSKHYFDFVADATGISIANFGISGTGYARSQPFYQRISSIPSDVDVITIFGSGNDSGSDLPLGDATDMELTSLCGYINKCINEVQSRFPLVPFGIITPTPWVGFEPNERMNDNWFINYSAKIVEICRMRGVPYLDLYHCSNLHPSNATFRTLAYSKDNGGGVHPDENGHKIIASRFSNFIDSLLI